MNVMKILPQPTDALTAFSAGRASNVATNTAIEIQVGPSGGGRVFGLIRRLKVKYVSGGCANFTPLVVDKSGVVLTGTINQVYPGANTLIANLFDPLTLGSGIPFATDENGRLYLVPTPNAAADNVFDYVMIVECWR